MRIRSFRDLLVWQRGMSLARQVYALTGGFPKEEQFGLCSQMRRAAVSIPSNIAEGQGQLTDKAFALYLSRARGSLYELVTQAELAESYGFLAAPILQPFLTDCDELARMIHGLLVSVSSSSSESHHPKAT